MKTLLKKTGMLMLLFLAFGYARAGYVGSVTGSTTCSGSGGYIVITDLNTDGSAPYTVYLYDSLTGYSVYDTLVSASNDTIYGLGTGSYLVEFYSNADYGGTFIQANAQVTSTLNLSATIVNTTCPADTGKISLTVSGGQSPYSYVWSPSGSGASLSGLAGGSYAVTVTDQNGCTAAAVETVTGSSSLSAGISQSGQLCSPLLTASATGGTGTLSYAWSDGWTTDTTTAYSNASYAVTVTDANGCSASAATSINSIYPLAMDSFGSVNPGCTGNTGSITVHVLNGVGPYDFLWTPTEPNDSILTGLAAGNYYLRVTDVNNCVGSNNYYLTQNSLYAYISGLTNPTCGNSDGALTVEGYNGSGTYSYLWSTGASTASISGLAAGSYSVTVTDVNGGCTATTTFQLLSYANFTVTITTTPTACDTSLYTGTATAVITGTGGTAPYSFLWTGGQYWGSNGTLGTTQTISGLSYGTYLSVAVTDANGCSPQFGATDSVGITLDPSCYDNIVGNVFNDLNGNCIQDPGETGISNTYVIVTGSNGQSYYASPDASGAYDVQVLPGIYTVQLDIYGYGECVAGSCVTSYSDTFTTSGQVSSGNNFAVSGGTTFDLGVHPGCTPGNPGGTKNYWVYYYNQGNVDATGAVVTFVHDSTLTLLSTNVPYSSYDAATHTITWNVGTVSDDDFWTQLTMQFSVSPADLPGTVLYAQAEITPITDDCNPGNNIVNISNVLTGSHDPNSKEVSPAGNLSAADSVLTYTINFQNDGNAPANTIVIKDTLSPNVNPATVIPGAASAPYKFTMSGGGIMTFTFQGINLPDTSHGDSSMGFVSYTVNVKPNLPLGTVINNTASVYFDLNPAVVTNTTTNERSNNPNGIRNVTDGMGVNVVPNPAHDQAVIEFSGSTGTIALRITDALGEIIASSTVDTKAYTLDASALAPGIYFYSATDAAGHRASGKISVVR